MSTVSSYIWMWWLSFSQKLHPAIRICTLRKAAYPCTSTGSAAESEGKCQSEREKSDSHIWWNSCSRRMLFLLFLAVILALFTFDFNKKKIAFFFLSALSGRRKWEVCVTNSRWTNAQASNTPDTASGENKIISQAAEDYLTCTFAAFICFSCVFLFWKMCQ